MSEFINEILDARDKELKAAKLRSEQREAEKKQQKQYDDAFNLAALACKYHLPDGAKLEDHLADAEKQFYALGKLLTERGFDKYLPSIVETRIEAVKNKVFFAEEEYLFIECLCIACDPAKSNDHIYKILLAARERHLDLSNGAEGIYEYIKIRHENGGKLPERTQAKAIEPLATPSITPPQKEKIVSSNKYDDAPPSGSCYVGHIEGSQAELSLACEMDWRTLEPKHKASIWIKKEKRGLYRIYFKDQVSLTKASDRLEQAQTRSSAQKQTIPRTTSKKQTSK